MSGKRKGKKVSRIKEEDETEFKYFGEPLPVPFLKSSSIIRKEKVNKSSRRVPATPPVSPVPRRTLERNLIFELEAALETQGLKVWDETDSLLIGCDDYLTQSEEDDLKVWEEEDAMLKSCNLRDELGYHLQLEHDHDVIDEPPDEVIDVSDDVILSQGLSDFADGIFESRKDEVVVFVGGGVRVRTSNFDSNEKLMGSCNCGSEDGGMSRFSGFSTKKAQSSCTCESHGEVVTGRVEEDDRRNDYVDIERFSVEKLMGSCICESHCGSEWVVEDPETAKVEEDFPWQTPPLMKAAGQNGPVTHLQLPEISLQNKGKNSVDIIRPHPSE